MLGKFSRWLRILGYDVDYRLNEKDNMLISLAYERCRILLTKDVDLYRKTRRADAQVFLLKKENEAENLAEIARHYGLDLKFNPNNSRCPKCNSKLRTVPIEVVIKLVPSSVSKYQNKFWQCTNSQCRKIYWHGSHWRNIKEKLEEARNFLKS